MTAFFRRAVPLKGIASTRSRGCVAILAPIPAIGATLQAPTTGPSQIILALLGGGVIGAIASALISWYRNRHQRPLAIGDAIRRSDRNRIRLEKNLLTAQENSSEARIIREALRHEQQFQATLRLERQLPSRVINSGAARLPDRERKQIEALLAEIRHAAILRADAMLLHSVAYYETGQYDLSLEFSEHVLQTEPHNLRAANNKAAALVSLGRCDEAVSILERVVAEQPDRAEFRFNLANAYLGCGDHNAAIHSYDVALSLAPDHDGAWANLGHAMMRTGRHQEAIQAYTRAHSIAPTNGRHLSNRSVVHAGAGNYDLALADATHAISVSPGLAEAHYNLSVALGNLGQVGEAISACKRAVEINPGIAIAWSDLAHYLCETGDASGAIHMAERALSLSPKLAEAHANRAEAYLRQGFYRGAVIGCNRALAIDPELVEVLILRARAYKQMGFLVHCKRDALAVIDRGVRDLEMEELVKDVERVLGSARATAMDPVPRLHRVGERLVALGRLKDAERVLRSHLRHYPYDAAAWLDVARVNDVLGDASAAQECYGAVVQLWPECIEAQAALSFDGADGERQGLLA